MGHLEFGQTGWPSRIRCRPSSWLSVRRKDRSRLAVYEHWNVHDVHGPHNCWLRPWTRNSWVVSQSRRSSSQVGPKPILNFAEEWTSGKDQQRSFRCHTRNYLATMAAVDPEILVGRQNDGISKRFGHANKACVGEAHRNVRVLFDQFQNGFYAVGKFEGDQQSTAAKQCTEIGCAKSSEKVEGLG